MKRNRVIVIGSLNYDMFLQVQKLPQLGETYQADGMQTAAGGKGANQAVQCARLGLPTLMVGAVGKDAMGDYLKAQLAKSGVDTANVRSVEGSTGLGVVHVLRDGGVLATIVQGANDAVDSKAVHEVEPLMENAFAVVLQMEIPMETVQYAMEVAHFRGARVILNAAPAKSMDKSYIHLCDTFVANEVEAAYYTGRTIHTVQDALDAIVPFVCEHGVRAIFTLGALGSVACDGGAAFHEPAAKTTVVETTGAGDSFVGGYVKAQSEGLGFAASVRFAAQCSAVTVAAVGGQDAMPTLLQMQSALKTDCEPLSDLQNLL